MFWDKRFAAEGKIWGDEPSVTAWRAASLFTAHGAQSALVLGCGYGRIISAIRTWRHISPASRSCSPRLSMSRKITHRMARICTSYGPWLFVAPLESLALSPAPVAAGCELTGASVAYINGIGPSNVPTRRSGAVRQEGLGMPSPYVVENKRSGVGARHASPVFRYQRAIFSHPPGAGLNVPPAGAP